MKPLHLLSIPLAASLSFYGCGTSDDSDNDSDADRADAGADSSLPDTTAPSDTTNPSDLGTDFDAGPGPITEAAALEALLEEVGNFCDAAAGCGEFPSASNCVDEFESGGPDFNTVDSSTRVACITGYTAFIACAADQPCESLSAEEPPAECVSLLVAVQDECEGLSDYDYEYDYEDQPE